MKQSYKDANELTTYQAGVLQAASNRHLQKICDDILGPFNLTKTQWLVIGTVADAGKQGIRISELALELGTTLPFLTNTINQLESKQILNRQTDKSDSRSKYVSVNSKYLPNVKKIETVLRQELRKMVYNKIKPSEFRIYIKVMQQLQAMGD
jgi:DNA-binding MarR family transcriptional regulator